LLCLLKYVFLNNKQRYSKTATVTFVNFNCLNLNCSCFTMTSYNRWLGCVKQKTSFRTWAMGLFLKTETPWQKQNASRNRNNSLKIPVFFKKTFLFRPMGRYTYLLVCITTSFTLTTDGRSSLIFPCLSE
jgi:hypothetical protein